MTEPDQIVVLYTGGYDSLTVAVKLAEAGTGTIHLLTCSGYTTFANQRSCRNVEKLRQNFPATAFVHKILDVKSIQRKLLATFFKECTDYDGRIPPFGIWCANCIIAMKIASIVYCLKNDIGLCADGTIRNQAYYQVNTPEVSNVFKKLYASYGIRYFNPIYDYDGEPRNFLLERGYDLGTGKRVSRSIQPLCIVSWFSTNRIYQFAHPVCHSAKGEHVESKTAQAKELIDHYLEGGGIRKKPEIKLKKEDFLATDRPLYQPEGSWKEMMISRAMTPLYLLIRLIVRAGYFLGW